MRCLVDPDQDAIHPNLHSEVVDYSEKKKLAEIGKKDRLYLDMEIITQKNNVSHSNKAPNQS
jgi:hypothetical protein